MNLEMKRSDQKRGKGIELNGMEYKFNLIDASSRKIQFNSIYMCNKCIWILYFLVLEKSSQNKTKQKKRGNFFLCYYLRT